MESREEQLIKAYLELRLAYQEQTEIIEGMIGDLQHVQNMLDGLTEKITNAAVSRVLERLDV